MFTLLDPPSREENTSCSLLEEGLRSDDSDEYQTPSEEVMFQKKTAAERLLISL